MATINDFKQRQRERERRRKIRAQRNKKIAVTACIAAVIIIIIASIASCSGKNKQDNQGYVPENANNEITASSTSSPTEAPKTQNISGIANIPSADEENDLLKIVENSSAEYYAYLTFDDGPTKKITPQILDTLRRYDVKATFFEVGAYIRQNTDIARRVYEEGHLIASHSDSHDYDKLYATESAFKSEIEASYESIRDVSDDEPFKLMRFPGGSYNAGDHAEEKQEYKKTLADMGFYYIDWNALNGDAEGRTKDADGLLEYLKDNMPSGGKNIVVLMHDASTKQATADALPKIIEYLSSEGYSFHRLDDIPYDSSSSIISESKTPADNENNDD
ncbi:MAG: polysaccharide deacetylase family protein [bacterium]|nr:polysaccharide deacetylase family protein [bacterium]